MVLSTYLNYASLLPPIYFMRGVHSITTFVGKLKGNIPNPDIKPFETIYVDSTKSTRRIRVDVYRNAAALKQDVGPVAVHITWHGSGYIWPALGENRPFIEYVMKHDLLASYPLVILDCDYAKAPEHPCPSATDDARDVVDYVFNNPSIYNLDKVTIGGFSAGGAIALGTSHQIGLEASQGTWPHPIDASSTHPIKAVTALYPPTEWEDRTLPTVPKGEQFPGIIIPIAVSNLFDGAYFFPPTFDTPFKPLAEDPRIQKLQANPLITPSRGNPEYFPDRVVLITCEYDTVALGTEKLRRALQEGKGKGVYGWRTPKVGHGWDGEVSPGMPGFEERNRAYDLIVKILADAGGLSAGI